MNRLSLWIVAIGWVLIVLFPGCRSMTPSVTYYLLNPMAAGPMSPPADAYDKRAKIVGIRPIELPGYINRTPMVKRTGPNQIEIASFHRWADYPDRMIQRVLAENLQLLMADARVYSVPWPAGLKPDVTVDFSFLELIGTTDNKMMLSTVWTITGSGGPSPYHRTTLSETMTGTGFDDLAAALRGRIARTRVRRSG